MDRNPYEPSQLPLREEKEVQPSRAPSIIRRIGAVISGILGVLVTVPAILLVSFLFVALFSGGTLGTPESVSFLFFGCFFSLICGTLGAGLILASIDLWNGTQRFAWLTMVLLAPFLLVIAATVIGVLVTGG